MKTSTRGESPLSATSCSRSLDAGDIVRVYPKGERGTKDSPGVWWGIECVILARPADSSVENPERGHVVGWTRDITKPGHPKFTDSDGRPERWLSHAEIRPTNLDVEARGK